VNALARWMADAALRIGAGRHGEWISALRNELDYAPDSGAALEWALGGLAMSVAHNLEQTFFPWTRRPDEPPPFGAAALIGFLAVAAPAYFVGAAVLYVLGAPIPATTFNFVSPPLLLLGAALCAWINLGAMLAVGTGGSRALRVRPRLINMALLAAALLVIGGLAYHAVMERVAGW
jgi:hypothetical protein